MAPSPLPDFDAIFNVHGMTILPHGGSFDDSLSFV